MVAKGVRSTTSTLRPRSGLSMLSNRLQEAGSGAAGRDASWAP